MSRKNRAKRAKTATATPEEFSAEQPSTRLKSWLPALTGLAVFLVYLRTLFPTVGGGDSGEFVATACATGVAHPPGYPLYTVLAKLFTYLPIGVVAWRVNLLSAICGSAASVMILLAVRRWTRNDWAGLLAAGLFAFSPLVWRYAIVAEVFSLNHLLVATLLYTAVRYSESRDPKFAYLSALVFGLGMSNHHTCLFYGTPLMLWILVAGRRELWTIRRLLAIAGCFLAGLLPYAYLPLADAYKPAVSWGNASTVKGFLTHVMRSEYGTLQLGPTKLDSSGNFLLGLKKYFWNLPHQVFFVGLVLAVVGLFHSFRQKRSAVLTGVTVVAFCFYLITFHALANLPLSDPLFLDIHSRFWPLANLMICVWAGLGFNALGSFIPRGRFRDIELAIVALLVICSAAVVNFATEDQHDNTVFGDYGRELFRPLPQGTLVWTKGDLVTNVMRYLQQCEGERPDVRVLDRELLRKPWMNRLVNYRFPDVSVPGAFYGPRSSGYDAKQFFDANVNQFKIFVNLDADIFEFDRSWDTDYAMRPLGSFRELVPRQTALEPTAYIQESEKMLPVFNLELLQRYPAGSWENVVLKDYWTIRLNRANFLISYALNHGNDRLMLEAGAGALEDLISRQPYPDPFLFKRLGLAYNKLAVYDPAYKDKMKTTWQRYLDSNPPPNDPDLMEIRKAVSKEMR
jgi:dolichyl-phosphate-mannose-protein mannosyltransferase